MAGSKRSSRLAARKSKPKRDNGEEDHADESKKSGSDDADNGDGECEFSPGGEGSEDDDSPIKPARRRGKMDRQKRRRSSDNSNGPVGLRGRSKTSKGDEDEEGNDHSVEEPNNNTAYMRPNNSINKRSRPAPPVYGSQGEDKRSKTDGAPGKGDEKLSLTRALVDEGNGKSSLSKDHSAAIDETPAKSGGESSAPKIDRKGSASVQKEDEHQPIRPAEMSTRSLVGDENNGAKVKDDSTTSEPKAAATECETDSTKDDPIPPGDPTKEGSAISEPNAPATKRETDKEDHDPIPQGEPVKRGSNAPDAKATAKKCETESMVDDPIRPGGATVGDLSERGSDPKPAIECEKGEEMKKPKSNDASECKDDTKTSDDAPEDALSTRSEDGLNRGGTEDSPASSSSAARTGNTGKSQGVVLKPAATPSPCNAAKKTSSSDVTSPPSSLGDSVKVVVRDGPNKVDSDMGPHLEEVVHGTATSKTPTRMDIDQSSPAKIDNVTVSCASEHHRTKNKTAGERVETIDGLGAKLATSTGTSERTGRIVSENGATALQDQSEKPMDLEMCSQEDDKHADHNSTGNVSVSEQFSATAAASAPKTTNKILLPTAATSKQSPKQRVRPHNVGQLKMALFLEASRSHRGNAPLRAFAKYWETLERYISSGHNSRTRKARSDESTEIAGTEAVLSSFLKTRRMRRLHNKLVLAIMTEAMMDELPARCTSNIPQQWQSKSKTQTAPDKLVEVNVLAKDRKNDVCQWDSSLGPRSGAWTSCGSDLAITSTLESVNSGSSNSIHPDLVGSIRIDGDFVESEHEIDDVLPSARLPGALEIDPLVRKQTAASGLAASDDAIWMMVVALQQYSSSLIERVIANEKDFADGHASQLPNHLHTSLACQHLESGDLPKDDTKSANGGNGNDKKKRSGKRVINSNSLTHVLAENPSVASSRLASMNLAIDSDNRRGLPLLSCPGLDDINCMVNSSIQRAASKREECMLKSALTSPNRPIPATSQPLSMPKFAGHGTNQSIPLHPQTAMPTQIVDQPAAQTVSYSNHNLPKGNVVQPTIPRAPVMPNSESLTKPGFPGITNSNTTTDDLKQQNQDASGMAPKDQSPPPKTMRRGSKNLAAMMARPKPSAADAGDKKNTASGNSANGASAAGNAAPNQKKDDGSADTKKDGPAEEKKTDSAAKTDQSGRGRGFGRKNLAAMRARTSVTDLGK